MYYFCTYFDQNYLSRGLSLWKSLTEVLPNQFTLFVLSLDDHVATFFEKHPLEGIKVIKLTSLEKKYPELIGAKKDRKSYEYYFTLTPSLPWYIFETYTEIDLITYVDADIYFYSSPKVLFDELGDDSILIIPHFFSKANKNLEDHGKYNVVFNTFRRDKDGLECLDWWRTSCIDWCYDYVKDDKFADQKYLDKFQEKFNKVKVCENRGANLAIFNLDNSNISYKKGVFSVDNYKLVFYHFHHLRRVSKHLFSPNFMGDEVSFFKNKYIRKIYISYIKTLIKYEKKYNLRKNQTERYKTGMIKGKKLIRHMIYRYSYYVYPLKHGVVHLDKYYKPLRNFKLIFKKNGKTNKS